MTLRLNPLFLIGVLSVWSLAGAEVYVPLTFQAEQQVLKTSACFKVVEWTYPKTSTWSGFGKPTPNPAEAALEGVVAAIRQKNLKQLLQLSEPGMPEQEFNRQAEAFFSQFAVVQLVSVPRAYALDGLVIFFGNFRTTSGTIFVPLVFRGQPDDSFRFLPSRTQQIGFTIVSEWFDAPWGPGKTESPSYCSAAEISRATYRAPLTGARPVPLSPQAMLYLRGQPVATNSTGGRSPVNRIQSALAKGTIEQLLPLMAVGGANRLRAWYQKASTSERAEYIQAIASLKPFFDFDADPLTIVYGRDASGSIHVMYFTPASNGGLLWTNSSHITSADAIFSRGVLLEQASLSRPFSGIEIRK